MLTTEARQPIGANIFGYGNEIGHMSLQRITSDASDLWVSADQSATLGAILYDQRTSGAVASAHILLMDAIAMAQANDGARKTSMAIMAVLNRGLPGNPGVARGGG